MSEVARRSHQARSSYSWPNKQILIFEGTDKVGKSSIIRQFMKLHQGWKIQRRFHNSINHDKRTYYDENTGLWNDFRQACIHEQSFWIDYLKCNETYHVLMDRSYISEMVYSEDKGNKNTHEFNGLDNSYSKLGARIIWCDNEDPQPDEIVNKQRQEEIRLRYPFVLTLSNCKWMYLNTAIHPSNQQLMIRKFYKCLEGPKFTDEGYNFGWNPQAVPNQMWPLYLEDLTKKWID